MKPITFESIRNFLKTKKKNKKDGADTSFKRSDSFKRISIRKSYLDRGRKRASRQQQKSATAIVPATSNNFKESEVKNGIFVGRPLIENKRSHCDDQESDGFCLKNKSLQEINELCAADDFDDIICDTEVQTLAIDFQGGNSTESIYNELNNDVISNSPIDAIDPLGSRNISQISISLDDTYNSVIDAKPAVISPLSPTKQKLNKIIEDDDDHKSTFSNNSFFLFGDNVYDRADSVNGSSHRNAMSSFDRTNTQRSDDTDKQTADYRSSFDKRSLKSPVSPSEMPSLVTFKTYCEPTKYLETSFDSIEPHSINHSLESQRSNVSKTSLNCEALPLIDSQTFRLPKKYKAEKVVIRIPATVPIDDEAIAAPPPYTKQNLGKQVSNDSALDVDVDEDFENISANIINEETSDNGKFTFEIYRELQKTRDIKRPAPQRFLPGTSIEIASSNEDEVNSGYPADEYSFEQHNFRSSDDIETYGHQSLVSFQCSTLDEPFRSLQIDDKTSTNNFYCEEAEPGRAYNNDADIISPHSSIPYPLRIKTNPFTRQKELYSVNLGRIWKQLNLGQEDDMSMEATSMQGNFKLKNESFKSMSSRDSGFSLTLTKPSKSLFRRKSKKNRRKPKLAISRDGYFKRVMVVQRVSSRRKKKKSAPAKVADAETMFEQNFYETLGRYYRDSRRRQQYANDEDDVEDERNYYDNDLFMREFEEFCVRRNRSKSAGILADRYKSKNFDEFLQFNNADNFTQEISDLEAFFEEHLKRLKEYYLQKKKLNEQTINELYNDYDDDDDRHRHRHQQRPQPSRVQANITDDPMDEYEDVYALATNDTLKQKQRYADAVDNFENTSSIGLEFQFPHPDKRRTATAGSANSRGGDNKKRGKFKTQEVRDFSADNDHLKYASLEFSNGQHGDGPPKTTASSVSVPRDSVAYADLQFPAKEFLEFPYGKLKSNENRRMSRRNIKTTFQETVDAVTPVTNNISLSSIFPSISDTCQMCHKLRKNADLAGVESASDEFSENEFIANSIGCEMCLNCDKFHSDCDCSLSMNEKLANREHSFNANSKWCTCVGVDAMVAPIDDCALLSSSPNSCSTQNKRKVKRKKSKRRLGKNHSTLRREYTLSCNTSKFSFFFVYYLHLSNGKFT